jgi:hypothetical protein
MWGFADSLQNIVIDLGSHSIPMVMVILFYKGAWVLFVIVTIFGLWKAYMENIENKYASKIKWSLLAIDIPRENLQSTRAIENVFASLWPFYESINLKEKYIDGKFQQAFSLEMVSIGGYTQFLIRTPSNYKDLVEAAFYAQYPKAELTEVEDYTERYKELKFPSGEYDMFGSEVGLAKESPFPIRTYEAFEHSLTQTFSDPMSHMLEVFGQMNKDEELWMQMVITPIKDGWKEEGYKIINKIIGAVGEKKKDILSYIFFPFYYIFTTVQELLIYGMGYEGAQAASMTGKEEDKGPPNKMLYLTPEERNMVDGITMKISKLAYQTKLRFIYLAPKGKINKPKGAASFIGALQQFSTVDLNQFKPIMHTMTKANYFFVKKRVILKQNNLIKNFMHRSQTGGWGEGFVLNIEELATVFHLPIPEAEKENVRRVEAQKEAPPGTLPDSIYGEEELEEEEERAGFHDKEQKTNGGSVKVEPPMDLPTE